MEIKGKRVSPTLKNLKLSTKVLSRTFEAVKISQEDLQTACARVGNLSKTSSFRIQALQQYGSGSLAYSSLQAGLQYFMLQDCGYIAYTQLPDNSASVLVLADPICKPADLRRLLEVFLKEKSDPIFLHISHETGKILSEWGFCVNELGVETIIDIQEFELSGNKKQQLRAARNRAQKDGIKVREIGRVDDALMIALKKVSDDWLNEKVAGDSQMKFIVRPLVYVDEIDVRRFVAIKDNKLVGFVIFDPMYRDGNVVGYIANQLRSSYEKGFSVVDYIILEAMQQFKQEGVEQISLGLSPLYKVDDGADFKHSKLLKANFQFAFENANYLYNFKNLARHKNLYRPEMRGAHEEKVYCAQKTRFLLNRMYSVYVALGLNPLQKTYSHLSNLLEQKWRSLIWQKPIERAPDRDSCTCDHAGEN